MTHGIQWTNLALGAAFCAIATLLGIFVARARLKARAKRYKEFFRILWIDLKTRIGEDAILPSSIQESLNMFYPELPKFDQCFKTPVKNLIAMVQWTIDPRDHGIRIEEKKLKRRKSK